MVVEEMEVEEPVVEGTLVKRFINEKAVVKGSLVEDTANKKWKLIHCI